MPNLSSDRPDSAQVVTTYAELIRFVEAFRDGKLSTLLIIGKPGLAKSRLVSDVLGDNAHFLAGQTTALGLFSELAASIDEPLVLDDLDGLFADRSAVRLLKALLETKPIKVIEWHTQAVKHLGLPTKIQTKSSVILITNSWRTLNTNVAAVEDRAHVLSFEPAALEVHQQVGKWFWDQEIFDFIGGNLTLIKHPSMRVYVLAWERKNGGMSWRDFLLARWLRGNQLLAVQLLADPSLGTQAERAAAFTAKGGGTRATFYNVLKRLPPAVEPPKITLMAQPPSYSNQQAISMAEILRRRHGRLGMG
jgi:hypothetical protein